MRHQHSLQERPQQVDRVQEGVEVVVVEATRLAEQDNRGELAGEERQDDGDAVKRGDRDHPGHDPGADQVGDRPNSHGFQRIDLFADPHGTQLGGHTGAEGGGQADAGDHRRRQAHVDECRQETGQRFDADVAQRAIPLNGERASGGQGQESDDHDRSADHRQSPCAHADFGDEPHDLPPVAGHRERYAGKRPAVEQGVVAYRAQCPERSAPLAEHPKQPRIGGFQRFRRRRHGMFPITSS